MRKETFKGVLTANIKSYCVKTQQLPQL